MFSYIEMGHLVLYRNNQWWMDGVHQPLMVKLIGPGRFQRKFRKIIFQLILLIDGWSISYKIVLKWMPMDFTDGKSTLVQVMAWCRQATSHYLSECWPRSLSPYGFTRPQCVNTLRLNQNGHNFADDTLKCIFLTLKSSEALNPRELCYYISRSSFVFIQIWLQCITWGPIKIISFDSGNGLALNRQQALTWISDDPVQLWKYMCHLSSVCEGIHYIDVWYEPASIMKSSILEIIN